MQIVVITGQPLLREGCRLVLSEVSGLLLVGTATHAREGFRIVDACQPDAVAVDIRLPGLDGLGAVRELRRRRPEAAILVLGDSCNERQVLESFAAGARGFLAKEDPKDTLVEALRTVCAGLAFLGPSARTLSLPDKPGAGRASTHPAITDVLAALSAREREVFDLAVRGFRNREIAGELCISVKTVGSHRLQVNRKLGCSSGVELLRFAVVNGLVTEAARADTAI